MKGIVIYHRSLMLIAVIVFCVFLLTRCINGEQEEDEKIIKNSKYGLFAGSANCAACHKKIYESHIQTAHFHTSEMAIQNAIKGSFDSGKNSFHYSTGGLVRMEKRNGGLYQVAYVNGTERVSQRFDIITGSGTKGQTFLTWTGNNLFQLPVTYFTSKSQWCNSPGNPNKIALNRPITSRCLECHTTFVEKISAENIEPEAFDKNQMILGVDCEKCHGPGLEHVKFHQQNPAETKGKFIINPASFSRLQSLDLCALCHGGRLQKTKPSFEFMTGDKLSDFFLLNTAPRDVASIDVHGNQYGLLTASKCFINSEKMTCITCHNIHENEKGATGVFSQRCISCHTDKHSNIPLCKMTVISNAEKSRNCTSCHMPEIPSKAIAVLLQGEDTLTPASMHTHLIKVYPEETKKVLAFIKNQHLSATKQKGN